MATKEQTGAQPQADLPALDDPELSLDGTFRTAVDTLMTMQPFMERIRAAAGDEAAQGFVRDWKQALLGHLQETAQLAIDAFVVDWDHYRSTGEFSFSFDGMQQAQRELQQDRIGEGASPAAK